MRACQSVTAAEAATLAVRVVEHESGRPRLGILGSAGARRRLRTPWADSPLRLGVSRRTIDRARGRERRRDAVDAHPIRRNDEPHFRAGLFSPDYNEDNGRLLNVALTRARRRLIVVGDFTWLSQKAHRQSILRQIVEQLARDYPLVSALDVIPAGFAARAAEAHLRIIGGQDAPDLKRIVVTQDDYYRLLARDLENARNRVVFYSAFLTQNRVAYLEPHLRAEVERQAALPTAAFRENLIHTLRRDRASVRQAFVLSELLAPPLALTG